MTQDELIHAARERGEAEAREADRSAAMRGALALEAGQMASFDWDLATDEVRIDDRLCDFMGVPRRTLRSGAEVLARIDARDRPDVEAAITAALENRRDYDVEFRVAGKPPQRWLGGRGRVVERDPGGRPLRMMGVNWDVTEQKRQEFAVQEASDRYELALREVNHRVANLFTLVPTILSLTARTAPDVRTLVKDVRERIAALARSHALTLNSFSADFSADFGAPLDAIIRAVLEPYQPRARAFVLDGPPVRLSARAGNAMSLTLHELATNAAKYGALSVGAGRITIVWRVEPAPDDEEGRDRLRLVWSERGGPPVERPTDRGGFGTTLIDRMVAAQDGGIERDWAAKGLEVVLVLPLAHPRPRTAVEERAT